MLLGLGTPAGAAPLDRRQVATDAKWLVHLDFDAMRAAKTAQGIQEKWLSGAVARRRLEEVQRTIGMDPLRDLRSITLYGTRFTRSTGVVLVRAKMDRQRLLGLLKHEPSHRITSYGDYELHRWTQNKGKQDEHTVTGCFHGAETLVLGRVAAEVKTALDVLDAKVPHLTEANSLLSEQAPEGTVLQARAAGLAEADLPVQSPISRQIDGLSLVVGEHEGEVFALARLVAKTNEAAGQIRSVLEGFLALARLQANGEEEAIAVLEAIQLRVNEKTVTVECRGPHEEVLKLMEQVTNRQAERAQRVD